MKHFDDLGLDAFLNRRATNSYKWDNMGGSKGKSPTCRNHTYACLVSQMLLWLKVRN